MEILEDFHGRYRKILSNPNPIPEMEKNGANP
jgi:hypothetical protein